MISDDIKRAIETSGQSLRNISRETDIHLATLSRFVNGQGGLSLNVIDRLCKYLGLSLKPDKR